METPSVARSASQKHRVALAAVRGAFVVSIIGLLTAVSFRGQWEAQLRANGTTFISHLPDAPIWQPPVAPDYAHFTAISDTLPNQQPDASVISVVFKWHWVAIDFLLWFWGLVSATGVLYLLVRGAHDDPLLHFVLYTAVGLTAGGCTCIGLWIVLGGWGPPRPLFFAICGLLLGLVVGVLRWGYRYARRTAERPRVFTVSGE